MPGTLLSELIQRGGDVLYSALRKGVGDATDGLEGLQRNVRRFIGSRDREGARLNDWVAYAAPDFERLLQGAVERVLRLLDLPRRSDVELFNKNLERVANALEELEAKRSSPASDASKESVRKAPDPPR
ncbi:MAG TPA: hypothetical protein DEP35_21835 [Deltaproteobacteria bacterium]|nr:hypothetical protein [Deltaproteobacteria bacterium]